MPFVAGGIQLPGKVDLPLVVDADRFMRCHLGLAAGSRPYVSRRRLGICQEGVQEAEVEFMFFLEEPYPHLAPRLPTQQWGNVQVSNRPHAPALFCLRRKTLASGSGALRDLGKGNTLYQRMNRRAKRGLLPQPSVGEPGKTLREEPPAAVSKDSVNHKGSS